VRICGLKNKNFVYCFGLNLFNGLMFGLNLSFKLYQSLITFSFSTNLSLEKKALPKKHVFLVQVLSFKL
jgi:hypothetical protein